jgi:Family of unknown function (DUF6166)
MYIGKIVNDGEIKDVDRIVTRAGEKEPINPRYDLVNHSPTGFCWGYGGSGPAQLALAILADYLKDDQRALSLYMEFKFMVITRLPMDEDFTLTDREIENAISMITIGRMKRGYPD